MERNATQCDKKWKSSHDRVGRRLDDEDLGILYGKMWSSALRPDRTTRVLRYLGIGSSYLDVSAAAGPVERRASELGLALDVRAAGDEQFDERQLAELGGHVDRRPAVGVHRVHVAAGVVDQHPRGVRAAPDDGQMERRRAVDVDLVDGGRVVDEKAHDARVPGRRGDVQRRAAVVATGGVDGGAVTEQQGDDRQQLVTYGHVQRRHFVAAVAASDNRTPQRSR